MDSPEPPGNKVSFLGPPGTFSEQALLDEPFLADVERVWKPTTWDVLAAVVSGEAELGFAALENSIEGTVNMTLDALAFTCDLLIQHETIMPIQLHLLAPPGAEMASIQKIWSFPHALAQCTEFLHKRLPEAPTGVCESTADAARMVAELEDRQAAAIASARAAEAYGLEILASDIGHRQENETRFVTLASAGIPPATGHDKSSIVTFQRDDRPGSLLSILQEFAARSINLTKLESRPTKQSLGNYCFIIDLEGHVSDELVADCLVNIQAKHAEVKFLGSYPAAGAEVAQKRRDADEGWRKAKNWMEGLRGHLKN